MYDWNDAVMILVICTRLPQPEIASVYQNLLIHIKSFLQKTLIEDLLELK